MEEKWTEAAGVDAVGELPECPCGYGPLGSCAVCIGAELVAGFEEWKRSGRGDGPRLWYFGVCEACGSDWDVEFRSLPDGEEWWQGARPWEGSMSYDVERDVLEVRCVCGAVVQEFGGDGGAGDSGTEGTPAPDSVGSGGPAGEGSE